MKNLKTYKEFESLNSSRDDIIDSVQHMLPEALVGFGINSSKSLVEKSKELIDFIYDSFEGEFDLPEEEIRNIIRNTIDNWEF